MSPSDNAAPESFEEGQDHDVRGGRLPSFSVLMHSLWLRKWWVVLTWTVLAIPAGVILSIYNLPRSYTSTTVLRFPNVVGAQTNVMRDVAITQGESIISVFNSFQVMESTIRKLGLRMRIVSPEIFHRNTFQSVKYGEGLGLGSYSLAVGRGRSATLKYVPDGSEEEYTLFQGPLKEDNRLVVPGLELELKDALVKRADGLVIDMEFKSPEKTALELRKGLSTRPLGTSNYEIKFKDRDPWMVADILNTLRDQFLEIYYGTTEVQDVGILVQMEKDLGLAKEKLEKSQDDVSKFYAQNPELISRGQDRGLGDNLSYMDARQDVERLSVSRRRVQAAAKAKPAGGTPEQVYFWAVEMLSSMVDAGDPQANILRSSLMELHQKQSNLRAQMGPEHPRIAEAEAQKTELYRQVDAAQSALASRLDQEVAEARSRMAATAPVRQANVPVKVQLELERLNSVNQNNQVIYDRLLESYNRAKLVTGSEFFKVTVVDSARPAIYIPPNLQNRLLVALAAVIMLLILVPAGFICWPLVFRKVWTKEDVQRFLRVKTLGVVAYNPSGHAGAGSFLDRMPGNKAREKEALAQAATGRPAAAGPEGKPHPLLLFYGDRHMISDLESYRVIREETESFFRQPGGKYCLLITSTRPNEGKTLTACNLAVTFARKGKRTLLIDADFRLGQVDKVLHLPPSTGLDELLAQPDMSDSQFLEMASLAFQPTLQSNLVVAPRRQANPSAGELVSSDRFKSFIRLAREQFDMVLIDAPPIMITPEPMALSEVVDGVIFVCRSGGTVVGEAQEAIEILSERNVKVGAIVNGVESSPFVQNRYTKYSYYYQSQPPPKPGKRASA